MTEAQTDGENATELKVRVRWSRGPFSLDLDVACARKVIGLVGPSGSGKTTLLHLVAGLRMPDAGRITFGGRVLTDVDSGVHLPPERRRVGLVFQDGRLFPHLSVRENLLYGHDADPIGDSPLRPPEVIDLLELGALAERTIASLSGGEKRRVAIGRTLLASPRLLLLDEPLSGLDAARKQEILAFLKRIREEVACPMVIVSHHPEEILALTRYVFLLKGGRLLGEGDFFELLGDPDAYDVLAGLGLENRLELVVSGRGPDDATSLATLGEEEIVLPGRFETGRRVRAVLKPTDVLLSIAKPVGLSARNVVPGTVREVVEVRGHRLVHLDVGQPLRVDVTRNALEELGIEPGMNLHAIWKTRAMRLEELA